MYRKKPRASSIKTAPTVVMTLLSMDDDEDDDDDDDDDNIDRPSSPSCHGLHSTSRTKGPASITEHTNGNLRRHRRHRRRHSPSSSSHDAFPITRRRPHKDCLVSTAHSLASTDSVRAELERIQNLGREVPPSAASLSPRGAAESNTNTNDHHDDKNMFCGYNHRHQTSSGLASAGELVGGGSVSSLSHLATSMLYDGKGSFSSTPRMLLNDQDNHNIRSHDPLSYNFVDSDSDDNDLGDVEKAIHVIRLEKTPTHKSRRPQEKNLAKTTYPTMSAHADPL